MAEVRKKVLDDKYNTSKIKTSNVKKQNNTKKSNEKVEVAKQNKDGFFVKFRIFINGVKGEFQKVHWPSKENMIKYSLATIFFIVFFSAFFLLIEVIFALISQLF